MFPVPTKDLLLWIKETSLTSEDKEALFLLIDLVGGISKKEIISYMVNPPKVVYMKETLNNLKQKWLDHISNFNPIQYISEFSYWRDLKFKISNDVLIPRVETEQIIDIVYDFFEKKNKVLFADLGTGSGVISISLAVSNPYWFGLATDINENAIKIAESNFNRLKHVSNLEFYIGNWFDPLIKFAGEIDLVIANPPYIPIDIYEELPLSVKNYEPKIALCGGKDGLLHISKIIKDSPLFLKKGGWLILENHYDQSDKVKKLLIKSGFELVDTIKDLFGIGRFTIGRYK